MPSQEKKTDINKDQCIHLSFNTHWNWSPTKYPSNTGAQWERPQTNKPVRTKNEGRWQVMWMVMWQRAGGGVRATNRGLGEGPSEVTLELGQSSCCQHLPHPGACGPSHSPGRPGSGTARPGDLPPVYWSWSGWVLPACFQRRQKGAGAEPGCKRLPHWLSGRSCPRTRRGQKQENSQVGDWE